MPHHSGNRQSAAPGMNEQQSRQTPPDLNVTLFVTCLADLFRPAVAFATIKLLEQAGCNVDVPLQQTCCGQPAYNSGDYSAAIPLAKQMIALLEPADYVVAPSGSCVGMICHHYPQLLTGTWRQRALKVAAKTFELTTFLHEIAQPSKHPDDERPSLPAVAYHDSCAGLRELGIRKQPRALLQDMCGVEVKELAQSEVCCGFGGTFCAKMPKISAKMADDKLHDVATTGARILTGGDLGCLLSIAGRAERLGQNIEVRHVAELLSGNLEEPPIGKGN